MKTSKFNEAQIAYIQRQAEGGTAIGEVCRSAGISEVTSTIGARGTVDCCHPR